MAAKKDIAARRALRKLESRRDDLKVRREKDAIELKKIIAEMKAVRARK